MHNTIAPNYLSPAAPSSLCDLSTALEQRLIERRYETGLCDSFIEVAGVTWLFGQRKPQLGAIAHLGHHAAQFVGQVLESARLPNVKRSQTVDVKVAGIKTRDGRLERVEHLFVCAGRNDVTQAPISVLMRRDLLSPRNHRTLRFKRYSGGKVRSSAQG